jgi:hypothetical protein
MTVTGHLVRWRALAVGLALGFWAASLTAGTASAEGGESPWAQLLGKDVEAMHRVLSENHPGAVDKENSAFRQWLAAGRAQALERAKRCDSFEGYLFALRAYGVGFKDGHLHVELLLGRDGARWPGFLAAWREGKLVVRARAKDVVDLPAEGSEILTCDGVPVADLLRRDVFPFAGNPDLEADWGSVAPLLFVDERNPWRSSMPKSCVFREATAGTGTTSRTRSLDFRFIGRGELGKKLAVARETVDLPWVIRPFGARGIWVGLPTFEPGEKGLAAVKEAIRAAPSWRDRDPIVFDVRGNGGGNSAWGHEILAGLYSQEYLDAQLGPRKARTYVEWRLSPGNVAHVARFVDAAVRERQPPEEVAARRAFASSLRQALAEGKSFWRREDGPPPAKAAAAPAPPNRVAGRVFLLTDGSCGSACLDFADMVLGLPGTIQVGRATYADSVYMEIRYQMLPSGVADLGLGVKVYRNRPRGNNQPYVPKREHRFSGDMRDTAALERWISALAAKSRS